jgi:hypothetical protein
MESISSAIQYSMVNWSEAQPRWSLSVQHERSSRACRPMLIRASLVVANQPRWVNVIRQERKRVAAEHQHGRGLMKQERFSDRKLI